MCIIEHFDVVLRRIYRKNRTPFDSPTAKYLLWDIDGTVLDFLASEAYAIKTLFKKYNLGECTDSMLSQYSAINVKYWQMLERNELTDVLTLADFSDVVWKFPEKTGFYQPVVIAKR